MESFVFCEVYKGQNPAEKPLDMFIVGVYEAYASAMRSVHECEKFDILAEAIGKSLLLSGPVKIKLFEKPTFSNSDDVVTVLWEEILSSTKGYDRIGRSGILLFRIVELGTKYDGIYSFNQGRLKDTSEESPKETYSTSSTITHSKDITAKEFGLLLGICSQNVNRLIQKGELGETYSDGKHRYISADNIVAFVNSSERRKSRYETTRYKEFLKTISTVPSVS